MHLLLELREASFSPRMPTRAQGKNHGALVGSDCHNELSEMGKLNHKPLFIAVLEIGKFKINILANSATGEDWIPGS